MKIFKILLISFSVMVFASCQFDIGIQYKEFPDSIEVKFVLPPLDKLDSPNSENKGAALILNVNVLSGVPFVNAKVRSRFYVTSPKERAIENHWLINEFKNGDLGRKIIVTEHETYKPQDEEDIVFKHYVLIISYSTKDLEELKKNGAQIIIKFLLADKSKGLKIKGRGVFFDRDPGPEVKRFPFESSQAQSFKPSSQIQTYNLSWTK